MVRLIVRFSVGAVKCTPQKVVQVASRSSGRTIKLNVYESKKNSAKPSPVLVNLHGSGFIIPMHGSDDEYCARVARETDYTVLDMQYRLAPECPFPAALEDVEDVVKWVQGQQAQFDPSHFAISGFSAGGNLALAAAGAVFPKDTFSSVLTFYPSTNKAVDPADRKIPDASGKVTPPAMSRIFDECYVPPTVDRKNPRVSPLFAPADTFPKNMLFVTAAQDNLCFEGEALAAKIEAASGKRNVVTKRMEGCGHGWDKLQNLNPVQTSAKNEAYGLAVEMLRE